jgi:hypothetical protein
MKPFWEALYAAKADVVLNGHIHNYERFAPQTPSGVEDDPARVSGSSWSVPEVTL